MSTISEVPVAPVTAVSAASSFPVTWSWADLQRHLGDVALERIRAVPPAGMATEKDLLDLHDHNDLICELVDGVLVEKVMGTHESALAAFLVGYLLAFLNDHPLGVVFGPDAQLRILPNRVRLPDVCVILWDKFPGRRAPPDAVFRLSPDLAVEILSEGNTTSEMALKLDEYRQAGVRIVWYIDPRTRSAVVHTLGSGSQTLDENGLLDGGEVLPGFSLPLRKIFDYLPRE